MLTKGKSLEVLLGSEIRKYKKNRNPTLVLPLICEVLCKSVLTCLFCHHKKKKNPPQNEETP